jgi:hypothetical protein
VLRGLALLGQISKAKLEFANMAGDISFFQWPLLADCVEKLSC